MTQLPGQHGVQEGQGSDFHVCWAGSLDGHCHKQNQRGEELMGRARLGVGEGVDVATDAGEDHVGADGMPLHLDGHAGHADPHMTVT